MEPFLRLLSEAAERPDVLSIRITIYRLASSSKIAHILCRAAENGKEVTVLMELRARFDEANNISWSKLLEDSGCRVIYGLEGYKCHSKICLITLRKGDKLSYITQVGTGNYNEKTNTMYTDLSLMTASEAIGLDGTVFFQNMLVGNLAGSYEYLLVSPAGIKAKLISLIEEEMAKGSEGYICIKANSMTEREVMDKLAEASRSGVQIQMILRGICCLRPGIPAHTENIHVTSIVGRYLEHGRIYCFGRGADAKVYISSADLMTRNLNRRVEIACPIYDPEVKEQLIWILHTQLEDNVKASSLLPDGSYVRKVNSLAPCSSQDIFMETSIHRESSAQEQPEPPAPLVERFFWTSCGEKSDVWPLQQEEASAPFRVRTLSFFCCRPVFQAPSVARVSVYVVGRQRQELALLRVFAAVGLHPQVHHNADGAVYHQGHEGGHAVFTQGDAGADGNPEGQRPSLQRTSSFSHSRAIEIHMEAQDLIAMLPRDALTKALIRQAIDALNAVSKSLEQLKAEMRTLAAQLPEYPVVMAMRGVGDSLGPQLMAEIGDVTRFTHRGAITAFAGVDPGADQPRHP